MRSTTLVLRKETLAELATEELIRVAGGVPSPTFDSCTLPIQQCAISLWDCTAKCTTQVEDTAGCQ